MTEQPRTPQWEIAHWHQAIEGLYQIAAVLNPAISESEVAGKALERVLDLPGVTGGCIKLLNADNSFSIAAARGLEHDHRVPDCAGCPCHERLLADQLKSVDIIDCPCLPSTGPADKSRGSHISVPLTAGSRTLGIMNLTGDLASMPGDEDFHVLETAGSQIAMALERASLYARMESLVQERTEALEAERNRLSAILDTTGALVILLDPQGRILAFNPACEKVLGWGSEEVLGRCFWELFVIPELVEETRDLFARLLHDELTPKVQSIWRARDGSNKEIIWSPAFLRKPDQSIESLLATGIDVTELRQARQQVQYLRDFDATTGLPNRNLFREMLKLLQESATADNSVIGCLMIDFARFPLLRESLGAKAEQEVLLQIAGRMQDWSDEPGHRVARLGDSSFALATIRADVQELASLARQLWARLDEPFVFEQQELHLEPCIGIAIHPNDNSDFDTLLRFAEIAMRRAKGRKTACFEFYKPELNRDANERFKLEMALRRALARNEFILHYQPQVDLRTGKMVGVEAPLRWQHPELGMVPPARFIGLAEETDLIIPIGAWVLRTACNQAREWQRAGFGSLRVGVNLSARQFAQQDLVRMIAAVLEESDFPAHLLDLELTESSVMVDVEHAVGVLQELRALGVHVSIDDFGTGYSCLSHLKRFPIDVLKIDQSFVREITRNSSDAAISDAIISLAHSLGIGVIAEGVETEEQCRYLSRKMCDEVQGYLFSRPLAAADIEGLLNEDRRLPAHLLRMHQPQAQG